MKTVAYISLCAAIAAAIGGIILQSIKIHKAGKSDKWTLGTIIFAAVFILISLVNLIWVIPNL
jgi:hypothetical protein